MMREYMAVVEKYTRDNVQLLRYMQDGKFDPYTYWNEVTIWLGKHKKYLPLFSKAAGKPLRNANAVNEEDPDLFSKLPPEVQKEAADWVIDWLLRYDPAEAPTYTQASLSKQRLIPRNTWLVHFTDNPDGIIEKGFAIGTSDMNKLALTTYTKNDSFDKQFGGYNFAFLAVSRDADNAAAAHRYGKHAVLFQNSGVLTYHNADEETQVIFHGEDVDPRTIVVIRHYDDWRVEPRRRTQRGWNALFAGDFDACIRWVKQNFVQYRRYLVA